MQNNTAVHDAVERDIALGKFLLHSYTKRLLYFEKKFGMKTTVFIRKFEHGGAGDHEAYFEWFALNEGKKHWKKKMQELLIYADK